MRLLALAAALAVATPLSYAQEPLRPVKPRTQKPAAKPEKARPGARKGVLPAPKKRSATSKKDTRRQTARAGGTPPRIQLPAAGVPSQAELEREVERMMEEMRRDMERQMGKGVGALPGKGQGVLPGKSSQRSSSSHTRRVVVVNGETVVDEETRDGKPVRRGGARRGARKGNGAGAPVRSDARAEATASSNASSTSSNSSSDSSSDHQRSSGNQGARKGGGTKGKPVRGRRAPAAKRTPAKPAPRASKQRKPSTKTPSRPMTRRGRRG